MRAPFERTQVQVSWLGNTDPDNIGHPAHGKPPAAHAAQLHDTNRLVVCLTTQP